MTTYHEVSIYFFHAGLGQAIAVRFGANHWIVVDGNRAGPPRRRFNPVLDLLRRHEDEPDFRLLGVVLSHFHADHFAGLPELLRHFRERGQLETVVIPATWNVFRALLERRSEDGRVAPLADLLQVLDEIQSERERSTDEGSRAGAVHPRLATVDAWTYLWPSRQEDVLEPRHWLFCFHPRQDEISKAFGKASFIGKKRRTYIPALDATWIKNEANHYCYVLGVGYGLEPGDLHVLLSADISGRAFRGLTERLRRSAPESRSDRMGPAPRLRNLFVDDAGDLRIRPLHGITIPHHGGGVDDLIGRDELYWWLGDPAARRGRRPVAVVQGGSRRFRIETMERFGGAGCRVFASSRPSQGGFGPVLDRRLLASPGVASDSPPEPESETRYVALHGGSGGLARIEARDFYEVEWPSCNIRRHRDLDE